MRISAWMAAGALVAAASCSAGAAQAQVALGVPAPGTAQATAQAPSAQPAWSFEASPYFWLTNVNTKLNVPLPGGGTVNQDIYVGIGQLLPKLRFGFMGAAEAHYGDFLGFTDLFYVNIGMNDSASKLRSITGPGGVVTIPVGAQVSIGTGLGTTIWTLGGGYAFAKGAWGEADGIAGVRMLNVDTSTNYTLTAGIVGPGGIVGLTRTGALSLGATYWDGIVGVKGRFNIGQSNFYVPYYFDIGTGGAPLTWQAFGGVGYRTPWADVSLGWRYLDYQKSGSANGVTNLAFSGLIAGATFHF